MNKAQILKLTGLTENAFYKLYPSKEAWDNELKKSQDSYKFGGPIKKYRLGGTDNTTDMGSTMYSTGSGNPISPGPDYDYTGNGYTNPEGIPTTNNTEKYKLTTKDATNTLGQVGAAATGYVAASQQAEKEAQGRAIGNTTGQVVKGVLAATPLAPGIAIAEGVKQVVNPVMQSTNPETSHVTKTGEVINARTDAGGDTAAAIKGMYFENMAGNSGEAFAKGDIGAGLGIIFGGPFASAMYSGYKNKDARAAIQADKNARIQYTDGSSDFYGNKNYTQDKIRETQLGNLPMNQDSTGYKYGGPMLTQKYGQSGTILKDYMSIVGPSHNNGGVTLQKMKNGGPMETNKELEGPEVVVKDTSGNPYVLSASLFDSKDTKGFAQGQKKDMKPGLFRPYDSSITGPDIARKTQERIQRHKALRTKLGLDGEAEGPAETAAEGGIEEPMMKYGGKMKYDGFGPSAYLNNPKEFSFENNLPYTYGNYNNQLRENQLKSIGVVPSQPTAYQNFINSGDAIQYKGTPTTFSTTKTPPTKTDWGNIAGMAGNFISPIASLALAFQKAYPNKEKLATTNLVDMSAANLAVDRNLDLFNSNYFANVKGAGQSRAQFLGNAGVHLGAASQAAGLQKSENSLKQHMINTQALNATSQYNAGARERNQEYGAKENAARREAMYKAFGDLGTAVSGTTKDSNMLKLNEKQFKQMLVMYPDLFPAGGIPTIGTDGYYHVKFPGSK